MTEATLTRNGDSITLPLLSESAGDLGFARDLGKPEAGAGNRGSINPRWSDQWSQLDAFTLPVRFTESDAYNKAIQLADMIKSHSGGNNLELDIPAFGELDSNMSVAPAPEQEQALSLAYDVGGTDWVDAELSLVRVNSTQGSGTQEATTPTATGNGPIQLSDGTNTVDFVNNAVLDRTVGRPNSTLRRSTSTYPNYIDHRKAAFDGFELGVEFTDNATSQISDLVDMISTPLGRNALALDFNGIYNMGRFDVVPIGSNAFRYVRLTAESGPIVVPSINLRRVLV